MTQRPDHCPDCDRAPDLTPTVPGSDTRRADDIPVAGEGGVDGPTVGVCTVPDLSHLTPTAAKAALEAAGCTLGKIIDGVVECFNASSWAKNSGSAK